MKNIRASVDHLCRDGASEISRCPYGTPRKSVRMASYAFKTHQKSLTGPFLPIECPKVSYVPAILDTKIRSYAIRVIVFFFIPAFSLLEPVYALNFSLNVSRDAGGVHRRKAIFISLPPIAKRDAWRAPQNDAVSRSCRHTTHTHNPCKLLHFLIAYFNRGA